MIKWLDFTWITVSFIIADLHKGFLGLLRSANCRDERGKRDLGWWGLKFGEKVTDWLKRELKEELNLDDNQYSIHFLWHFESFREHEGKPTHRIGFEHLVILNNWVIPENLETKKHDTIEFFPFDQLPSRDIAHSQFYASLTEFKETIENILWKSYIIPD